jgi:hypothetical protein
MSSFDIKDFYESKSRKIKITKFWSTRGKAIPTRWETSRGMGEWH